MSIFEQTDRPDSALFYKRNDPNDPRLGELVTSNPDQYGNASLVLLGLPQDEGVRRNGGRVGASQAPDDIRRYLYRLVPVPEVTLFDLGNTRIQATLEDTHAIHRQVVEQCLNDSKTVIVLGGGNDTSFPDCAALSSVVSNPLAFNVDTHFDVRADTPRNSGTPYRQLLEGGYITPDHFVEVGNHPFANSKIYSDYLSQKGVRVVPATLNWSLLMSRLTEQLQKSAKGIFWGIDMDVVKQSEAPGVSAPNPLGISGDQLCEIARLAGSDPRTRIFEITEVNPTYDLDGRTARLAALVIWWFMASYRFA